MYYFRHSKRNIGATLESPLVLLVLLLFAVFPLINAVALGLAGVSVLLTATEISQSAATQSTYERALQSAAKEATYMNGNGLNTFLHMRPVAGYNETGTNLFVRATSCDEGHSEQIYGPNTPVSDAIDTADWVYEYMAQSCYDVQPFVSFATVPFLRDIPGIGAPARICFSVHRVAEYPLGLAGDGNFSALKGGVAPFTLKVHGLDRPGSLTDLSNSGWNYPHIYDIIKSLGQTVVDEQVLSIDSRNWNWTDTKLSIEPGMKCWIDYRAEGMWSYGGSSNFDANGDQSNINGAYPFGSVLGKIGTTAPVLMGKDKLNYVPPGSGRLYLAMNDGATGPGSPSWFFDDNQGRMTVRVIITK